MFDTKKYFGWAILLLTAGIGIILYLYFYNDNYLNQVPGSNGPANFEELNRSRGFELLSRGQYNDAEKEFKKSIMHSKTVCEKDFYLLTMARVKRDNDSFRAKGFFRNLVKPGSSGMTELSAARKILDKYRPREENYLRSMLADEYLERMDADDAITEYSHLVAVLSSELSSRHNGNFSNPDENGENDPGIEENLILYRLNLGKAYLLKGYKKTGLEHLAAAQKALNEISKADKKLNSKNMNILRYLIAEVYMNQEYYNDAEKELRIAAGTFPPDSFEGLQAKLYLAKCCLMTGRQDEGISLMKEVVDGTEKKFAQNKGEEENFLIGMLFSTVDEVTKHHFHIDNRKSKRTDPEIVRDLNSTFEELEAGKYAESFSHLRDILIQYNSIK